MGDQLRMNKGFLQATKYLNSHLNPGETPLYRAHLSWIPMFVRQVPFMLAGSLVGGAVWGIGGDFLMGAVVSIILWTIGILSQIGQVYKNIATDILLTDQGLHSKHKLFAVEDDQFSRYGYFNDAVLDYNSVFQRLFQYGDIEVGTLGNDANFTFKCLAKPMAFKQAVRAAQQRYGAGGFAVGAPGMGPEAMMEGAGGFGEVPIVQQERMPQTTMRQRQPMGAGSVPTPVVRSGGGPAGGRAPSGQAHGGGIPSGQPRGGQRRAGAPAYGAAPGGGQQQRQAPQRRYETTSSAPVGDVPVMEPKKKRNRKGSGNRRRGKGNQGAPKGQ